MKILVTGGLGFVGSHYISEMEKRGHKCLAYDLPNYNILDTVQFRLEIEKHDMCVHFAAMADLNESFSKQIQNFEVNIHGTFHIARICAQENIPLIFISTCCVYGNSLDEIETEDRTNPKACEPYATSKIAGEAIIQGMPELEYSILRIGTVYGPGQRDQLFTGICLNNLRDGKTIYIDGDGNQTRQLIYIDDLIEGIIRATEKFDRIKREVVNLCGIEKISAIETCLVAQRVTNKSAIKVHRSQRYGQTFEENISIEKAQDLLGWIPKTDFYEGMKKTYAMDERYK